MNKLTHPVKRILSVWYRHFMVYTSNLLSNGFPPFFEPLIFLAGIGLGLGQVIREMDGIPYLDFLASGLCVSTAMMTAAYECTFGSFIRLEYEKIYDAILAAPISLTDMVVGEILWAGSKGFFFSFAVLLVVSLFGLLRTPWAFFVPVVGFLTGVMFASLSLFVTSFVKNIDHFSFYMTGFLSPMFFFSGIVFPTSSLPRWIQPITEVLPLTHAVRMVRGVVFERYQAIGWDLVFIVLTITVFGTLSIHGIKKRMIQ
ncbi:ABC transporter permease [Thermospira aquatica]|uniref:Transport permease protein n=1 Tax=Thermospira aquatica TaxID=2828656 RepID=A0AAX3BGE5_9SPIR|nr:ABC transporter permease [Thermospira aquatica]URA11279.1 ABC transporter permease [Thermospira aquatica]